MQPTSPVAPGAIGGFDLSEVGVEDVKWFEEDRRGRGSTLPYPHFACCWSCFQAQYPLSYPYQCPGEHPPCPLPQDVRAPLAFPVPPAEAARATRPPPRPGCRGWRGWAVPNNTFIRAGLRTGVIGTTINIIHTNCRLSPLLVQCNICTTTTDTNATPGEPFFLITHPLPPQIRMILI